MKKLLFMLLLTSGVITCAQAQSMGAGVSVDRQGNLKIDAPLYVIDRNPEKPGIIAAPATMNRVVAATIYLGDDSAGISVLFTGGIVKGRLSLTIKKPEEEYLWSSIASFWDIPADLFTSGADVKIGYLYLLDNDAYRSIILYTDYHVSLNTSKEVDRFDIDGDRYLYIYSMGEVTVSGKVQYQTWYRELDIRLQKGWNVIRWCVTDGYDKLTSVAASSNAVWVVNE